MKKTDEGGKQRGGGWSDTWIEYEPFWVAEKIKVSKECPQIMICAYYITEGLVPRIPTSTAF